MEITRDEGPYLIVESNSHVVWALAAVIGLAGPLAVVGFLYQMGSSWQGALWILALFGPMGLWIIYLTPTSQFCFNRKKRQLVVRQRWPWGKREETVSFAAIQSVSLHSDPGRANHLPAVELKDGRKLRFTRMQQLVGGHAPKVVERIGQFVNSAPTGRTQDLPAGTGPITVNPPGKPTHPLVALTTATLIVVFFMALPGRGGRPSMLDRMTGRAEQQKQEQAEEARQAKRERRAARERETFMSKSAAAEAGDVAAMCHVARAYADGKGTPQDVDQAIAYAKKAAAMKHPGGYTLMGNFYAKGVGELPENQREAEKWYLKAAERGSAEALYGLSSVYYFNKGVPQDLARAHAFMVLCARGKYFNSRTAVNIIGNKLSPAQRQRSARLVADWDRQHPGLKITS